MANAFSKEEVVAFEEVLQGFEDALVMSNLVDIYRTNATTMERANDTIWRPMPYIGASFDGMDQTANFGDYTQLSVPASINYQKVVPFQLTARELRDQLQESRLGDAAKQKLATDINVAVTTQASILGSQVIKRTSAAAGFDDVAQCDAVFNEQGIPMTNRNAAYSTRDYNSMAKDLANRQTVQGKVQTAYEKAYVGDVANFDVYKMDYANRLTAAAGTGCTMGGANQYYTPKATSTAVTGETSNVDNRFQTITVVVGGGTPKAGDAFTIAGVNSVHLISKQDTGQLKTFRIVSVVDATHWVITPPIISAGGGTLAEKIYQNVSATPATNAPFTFLNTAAAAMNPFWHKSAIELLPGTLAIPDNAGMATMSASTQQGLQVTMSKQANINNLQVKYRFDVRFGVAILNTEMVGIELFSQV